MLPGPKDKIDLEGEGVYVISYTDRSMPYVSLNQQKVWRKKRRTYQRS